MNIDLSQPVQLRLVKDEELSFSKYKVQFFNPKKNKWWTLPDGHCYLENKWSFDSIGGYGAYELEKMTCYETEFQNYKNRFKTLKDIQNYFDQINEKHTNFKKMEEEESKKPKIIY